VTITPRLIRVPIPYDVVRRALTRAEELRAAIMPLTIEDVPPPNIELVRTYIAIVVLFFFARRSINSIVSYR
jgi:hypothetical protein